MSATTAIITVSTVHPGRFGGAIFTGKDSSGRWVRVVASQGKITRAPLRGEVWRITGSFLKHHRYGDQLHVDHAQLLPPAGVLLIGYLTTHPAFRGIGIGQAKASRLFERFSDQLPELLTEGRIESLSEVLGKEVALKLIAAWRENGREATVTAFLDEHHVDTRLARKILNYWPDNTIDKLKDNPYRLLVLTEWPAVDGLAASLGIEGEDERRLIAAAEASVYIRLDTAKETRSSSHVIKTSLRKLLRCPDEHLPCKAIALAVNDGSLTGDEENGYQPVGCAVMERYLINRFEGMIRRHFYQQSLFSGNLDAAVIDSIHNFERQEGITLNAEQRKAVSMAAVEPLVVLKGGAGVGKTTVLKAIHQASEALGITAIQMALAGRAAQRMREATDREAYTIAGFLNRSRSGKIKLKPGDLVIIDEASMLDLMLAYRIMRAMPEGVRLLLVGDPHQLPPIGPGLIFHVLANSSRVTICELTQVHRQAESTGIPAVAKLVRSGNVPLLPHFNGLSHGVSFLECRPNLILKHILDIMSDIGGFDDAQILGVTKRGPAGVTEINRMFHQKLAPARRKLEEWELAEGVPVMYTVNDYDRDLYNGSLGCIEEIITTESGRETSDGEPVRVLCNFDGRTVDLTDADVPNLELAYAVTTHKAQGSQFKRVVIPVTRSRLLDRTLIYTALTRGVEQVVFVGDQRSFGEAIICPPSASYRNIGFSL